MTPIYFKHIRWQHGSQRSVAKRLGIGFRTLQRIEGGKLGDPVPLKYQTLLLSLSVERDVR